MTAAIIRPVRPEDRLEVYRVLYEAWNTSYAPILGKEAALRLQPGPNRIAFAIMMSTRTQELQFDVAEVDNRVVGFVLSGPGGYFNRHFVWMLYVDPAYQRQGVGRRLLNSALERAGRARAIRLHVLKNNLAAQEFYESHGFQVVCECTHVWTWQRIKVLQRSLLAEATPPVVGLRGYLFG
ncbi:MAG: N-acetyltransferase family protein [Hyphomicrobium sp.]